MANGVGNGGVSGEELGEVRGEVVAAAALELGEKVVRPVASIDFEGVGEDDSGGVVPKAERRGVATSRRWASTAAREK